MNYILDLLNEIIELFFEMAPYLMFGLAFVALFYLFITKEMVARHVGESSLKSIIKASLFGVPLPLCSCGVIPTSVFMAKNGASKSSVVSFLISTPQTGIDSIIATYGMMGWVFAIYRPFAAFIMGISGGVLTRIFDKKNDKNFIEDFEKVEAESCSDCGDDCKDEDCKDGCHDDSCAVPGASSEKKPFKQRMKSMTQYAFVEFLDDISIHFIIGIVIAGLISFFIPDDFFSGKFISNGIPGMLLMILVGVPMYVCATGSIPIALSLMMKGFSPGVAFAFLAAGPATNAASLSVISKTLGKRTAVIFVASISVLSLAFGLLLDYIFLWIAVNPIANHIHNHEDSSMIPGWLEFPLGIIFLLLLLASVYRKYFSKYFKKKDPKMDNKKVFYVKGMTCNHCVMNVKKAIEGVQGVTGVEVSLNEQRAYVEGDFKDSDIKAAVEGVGYEVVEK